MQPVDPSATQVVLMKLHRLEGGLKADQALAFKALAAEAMEAGMHFWILLHLARALKLGSTCVVDVWPASSPSTQWTPANSRRQQPGCCCRPVCAATLHAEARTCACRLRTPS